MTTVGSFVGASKIKSTRKGYCTSEKDTRPTPEEARTMDNVLGKND